MQYLDKMGLSHLWRKIEENRVKNIVDGNEYGSIEGISSEATGFCSYAEGYATWAGGNCSHAEGYWTEAEGDYSHVEGKYNIPDSEGKYLHILGNGTGLNSEKRSNAHTIDLEGNAWFQGKVKIGGTGQDDENSEYLATTSDISNYAYSKSEIDIALNNYINDIATLIGGEA